MSGCPDKWPHYYRQPSQISAFTVCVSHCSDEMCILFVYINPCPKPGQLKVVLASNRDEVFKRPAKPSHQWPDYEGVYGGNNCKAAESDRRNLNVALQELTCSQGKRAERG